MPSWNIHIAHTERLLEGGGSVARAVCDRNAFLLGNVVPDIFVGYMVPGVEDPIPYRITHFAKPEPIPKPREDEFWETYVAPLSRAVALSGDAEPAAASPLSIVEERERLNRVHYPQRYADAPPLPPVPEEEFSTAPADVERSTFDLVLGVWAHLLADNIWNTRVNEFLAAHGGKPSEQFRIKKQSDFDYFGKTLAIEMVPRASERLYQAAAAFPQYPIGREYVLKTIGVMHEIVRSNYEMGAHASYQLLTEDFFDQVFTEVTQTTNALFDQRLN